MHWVICERESGETTHACRMGNISHVCRRSGLPTRRDHLHFDKRYQQFLCHQAGSRSVPTALAQEHAPTPDAWARRPRGCAPGWGRVRAIEQGAPLSD